MSTMHQSRRLLFGSAIVFALTLLAPVAVTAEEDVAALVLVAAPSEADISADAVRATRVLAAERALQSGDIGSMQEERLLAIVANAVLAAPATTMTAEQTRVLAAQQALLSPDLGSLQEDALTAVVEASGAEVES